MSMHALWVGLLWETAAAFLFAVAAAVLFGLWRGERGRRRDLAWLVNREVKAASQATVAEPTDAESNAYRTLSEEERERLIQDTMDATGCSRADAEQDADHMLSVIREVSTSAW